MLSHYSLTTDVANEEHMTVMCEKEDRTLPDEFPRYQNIKNFFQSSKNENHTILVCIRIRISDI